MDKYYPAKVNRFFDRISEQVVDCMAVTRGRLNHLGAPESIANKYNRTCFQILQILQDTRALCIRNRIYAKCLMDNEAAYLSYVCSEFQRFLRIKKEDESS